MRSVNIWIIRLKYFQTGKLLSSWINYQIFRQPPFAWALQVPSPSCPEVLNVYRYFLQKIADIEAKIMENIAISDSKSKYIGIIRSILPQVFLTTSEPQQTSTNYSHFPFFINSFLLWIYVYNNIIIIQINLYFNQYTKEETKDCHLSNWVWCPC